MNLNKFKDVINSMEDYKEFKIILFDGICNLCNASVNFIIDKDKKDIFKFAALQSEIGKEILDKFNLQKINYDSFLLIENDKYYLKSTATLRVLKYLPGLWKLLFVFIIVPPFIRNYIYDFISRNRYKWFGKKETCGVPTPEILNKFIV